MTSAERRRVVVTGVGSVSALGAGGAASVSGALRRGVPGIGPVRAFSTAGCPSRLGGEVTDLGALLPADEARRLARVSQMAVVACQLAAADAGLEPGEPTGLGLVLGSHWGDLRSSEAFARGYLARGPLGLSPLVFPSTVMNGMAAHAAIALGARGPMLTLNQATVAGELAVARGAVLVQSGRATTVLAGGVDELSPLLYRELARLGWMSPGRAGPEGCWPFDRRANGAVLGEGATLVVLESYEVARARRAPIYAEVAAAAWGNLPSPAHGLPRPRRRRPDVIRRALAAAEARPRDVDAVYLTGAGDPAQDGCELDLVDAAFEGAGPPATALTPLTGEHAGRGGLAVAAAAVVTLGEGRLPGLPDLREPVRSALPFARPGARIDAGVVLVHGLARGGTEVALVLRRPVAEVAA